MSRGRRSADLRVRERRDGGGYDERRHAGTLAATSRRVHGGVRSSIVNELASPLPLAAVGLLALNDHVLKGRFPGLVTGKLSDLAGCFVLPLFVSAALALVTRWRRPARLAVGAAATTALFCAIKVSPQAASLVARALDALFCPLGAAPGRMVADPTDLLALPFVALAVLWAGRAAEERT